MKNESAQSSRRRLQGTVVSKSGKESIVVAISTKRLHPVYDKFYTATKKYHTHDPKNSANVGDAVTIEETRPISRSKRWRIV